MGSRFQFRGARSADRSAAEEALTGASPAFEKHYTVKEVAALWSLSPDTITRLFEEEEEGVIKIERKVLGRVKSRYRTIRISASALERKHTQLCAARKGQ